LSEEAAEKTDKEVWKMKRRRFMVKVAACFCIILLLLSVRNVFNATKAEETPSEISRDQEIENAFYPEDYSGYRFPVLPGTSTWPYGDMSLMIEACKIPESTLREMPTEELLQTVLVHPLILNVYAYENSEDGYENVKEYCDCLRELCSRQDRIECLYDYLASHRESFVEPTASVGDSYLDFLIKKPKTVLFVLAENRDFFFDEITDRDSAREYINSVLHAGRGIEEGTSRDAYPVEFHRIVDMDWDNKTYLGKVYTVHEYPMSAYKIPIIEEWLYSDGMYRSRYLDELSNSAKTQATNQYYGDYGIYPESGYGPTTAYNCHAYAWANTNKYSSWVLSINSLGFTETTYSGVNNGGIVVYCVYSGGVLTPWHSAVVYNKNSGLLKSKWGYAGLYVHTVNNCPYYGSGGLSANPRKYYNP
jgi:hypothetical protein